MDEPGAESPPLGSSRAPAEIPQDPEFQRREWLAERIGWVLIALVVVIALAGFLGPGPASRATSGENGFTIEYDRYIHAEATSTLRLHVVGGEDVADAKREVRVWVSDAYLHDLNIQSMTPQPARSVHVEGGVRWVFLTDRSPEPAVIRVRIRPLSWGRLDGEFISEGRRVRVRQFVYP